MAQRLNGSMAQRLNGSTAQRLKGSMAYPLLFKPLRLYAFL
jgi:hypothetical protein